MTEQQTDPESAPRRRKRLLIKIAVWTAAGVFMLLALAGVTIAILLHSERFHHYVLSTVQEKASDALGTRVSVQNFALHLSDLGLDLYGLTVDGAAPYANPPLLQVDHAQVSVRIISVLHGKWYLDSFRVDRPIVHVFVDARGMSNIPVIKSDGKSRGNTSLFDLAIRHAVLDRGEVYYNDRQAALSADLHDVDFNASFNALLQKYSGRLAYSNGHFVSGTLESIPHNLEAEFDATPKTFHLTRAQLTSGPSQVNLAATIENYNAPLVDASYAATIDGGQVGKILRSASVPTGQIRATGNIYYQQMSNRSLIDSLLIQGDLNSQRLALKTSSIRGQVANLAGHYSLANGDVTLQDLHANVLGGYLTATGTMKQITGDSRSQVNAKLHNVSLAELKSSMGKAAAAPDISLRGTLNAEATAAWGKTFNDLVAQADANLHGQAAKTSNGNISATTMPLDSAIHAKYTAAHGEIALSKSFVRTPQTDLTLNGVVSQRSSLAVRLQADDLSEVQTLASLFQTPVPGQQPQSLGLTGTASFQGTVTGSTSAPHLSGEFVASNFQVKGSAWKMLRAHVDAGPAMASLQHVDLEPASRGSIRFDASARLADWTFSKTSQVQVDLDAKQLNIADLAKLSGQQIPVSGTLNASLKLHGSELNPVGNGSVSLVDLVAYEQPVSSAKFTFSGTGEEAQGDVEVRLPAGSLQSKVSVRPQQRTYTVQLSATGIQLDKLQALKTRNVDATGVLSLKASGQGSFDNPQAEATLQIPELVIQKQAITGVKLQMNVADHFANATLVSSAVNTSIHAQAKVNLSGDYLADASLDTEAIPLQPLFAVYAPEQAENLSGQTEVHATLHGPLKNKNLLEAHITVPQLKLGYGNNIQLAAASPIHVDYKNGVIDLQRTAIRGTDTDLQFQASVSTIGNAPMSLLALGTVNLKLAQLFDPDVRTSGEVKFNINSSGTNDFGGQIEIVNAAFSSADVPVGMQRGNGTLTLSRDRLSISKFQGTVGGGTFTAQGGVVLRPKVQFDLGLSAQGLRMLYPQGMREGIDANLRLSGTTENATLNGSVDLSDVSFTSAFDLNSFISQFSGGVTAPPSQGFGQNLRLNVNVRSTSEINLVSRTLSIGGSANLQVRGTASDPVILGRINLRGGDVILNGDRFLLNGGTVEFINPSETQPVLNVSLKTTIQQYDVYLRFNGPVDQLRTNYSSDPALPSADIINLLAFGQTTEATSTTSPTSVVASQVSSQVTSRVSKIAGISQLSINPVLAGGGSQGPAGANITIQQRVTGNLFVTFSSNVASTQSQTIQGQYQLSPRVALSATRDPNGGFAFDTLIKKTW